MSTPKGPGPQLPDTPGRPPRIAADPATTGGTPSVLERLKAARPRTAGSEPSTIPESSASEGAGSAGPENRAGVGPRDVTPPTDHHESGNDAAAEAADRRRAGVERRRAAVQKARLTAGATARTIGRGGRTAGRSIGRGSRVAGQAIGRGSAAAGHRVEAWDPDIVRQSVVTLSAVACILGSAAGVGVFGGPSIADAAGGLFSPDATLLAPSSSAFSIWSLIYVGLVAYTVFQWLPSQRRSARQRRLGWTVAASMLLNLAWILSAQAGLLVLSLIIIMLLFFTLLVAVRTLNAFPGSSRLEGALVDTPIGLYLGWILVAAAANAAALLTARNADLFAWGGDTWAIVGIAAVLITAAVVCSTDRGRLAVAAATSWGLLWIAVERALGEPSAIDVAFTAVLAVFLLIITAGSRRHRVDHAYRRRLRAEQDAEREPLDLLADDRESLR
ncbi:tryptophan-rich sensory protein [Arthrobacter echini]|uniref:Tryptophan-rich sensory protein n=1 Tax=Arthrobacter echini TaxID=1529066 RepID=A0A5D0XPR6_9MICC|nr:TspO/MBR family protein [Arthrobacter echini]TYC98413.1 tryptophan-rich sensory protein [Arthrobacter echini]